MTWEQLRILLNSHADADHVSMNQPVYFRDSDGMMCPADIFESLTTGETYLFQGVDIVEEEDAG